MNVRAAVIMPTFHCDYLPVGMVLTTSSQNKGLSLAHIRVTTPCRVANLDDVGLSPCLIPYSGVILQEKIFADFTLCTKILFAKTTRNRALSAVCLDLTHASLVPRQRFI